MDNYLNENRYLKKEDLKELQKEKGSTCVSIIIPTHRLAPEKKGDKAVLVKAVAYVQTILHQSSSPEETKLLVDSLDDLMASIDFKHPPEGLGLFVSPNLKRLVEFPFPVKAQTIVRETFELRDLLYLAHFSQTYYVLEITEKSNRLFKGMIDALAEIEDANFPRKQEELYEYEKPSRGSSFTGEANLKGFEKDKSVMEEIRLKDFLLKSDKLLKEYISEKTPLILMGTEKDIALFKEGTHHQKNIMDVVLGSYAYASTYELSKLVWPKVKSYWNNEQVNLIRAFEEKKGPGGAVAGIQEVWKAATDGRGYKLLVEKDFTQPAFVGSKDYHLYLEHPAEACREITDAVEAVIQMVLEKDGEVIIVDNDLLQANGRIALITRY